MSAAPLPPGLHEAVRAARRQRAADGGSVLDILLRTSSDPAAVAAALAGHAGVTVVGPGLPVTPDFSAWDRDSARAHRSVVLRGDDGRLFAAAEDPWDELLLQRMARRLGAQPLAAAASAAALAGWLGDASPAAEAARSAEPEGPIVEFVDRALAAGFEAGASDVHFECDRGGIAVKHRLDGVLVPHSRMHGVRAAQEAISRIKVMARLDITEQRVPQDGRLRLRAGDREIDLRVSIMPSVHGEDAVLRLLDKAPLRGDAGAVTLDRLGFDTAAAEVIRELARAPSGMLLVTGPTGSGKTTTVYAALSEVNSGLEKIVTIEDPVEYELPGVLQIPVNDRKGLTFARGLRSILRHDPDRILVGEIRDAETAAIAVQSALTGHLVFTTVHANNVADIVGRFRHFQLDMFAFMSALNGVVVQRLLRQLCAACARQRPTRAAEQAWLERRGRAGIAELPAAIGCDRCRTTGYKGRFVLAELHVVDDELRDLVTEGAPLSALRAHAVRRGVRALLDCAIDAVVAGRTTIDEVRRVVGA